jgi:hypothetical protein
MTKLIEKNNKVLERIFRESAEAKKYSDHCKEKWGFDPHDKAMLQESFNWKKAAQKIAAFREAEVSSGWVQLLRAGVQNIANNMFLTTPTSWQEWVTVVPSSKDTELYAPLESVGFPNEVPQGGLFPEVSTFGLDIKLQNRKFGSMFAISHEAQDDDQTGQLVQRAQQMGEYLKILTEVLVMSKLLSPSGGVTYLNYHVPVSETQPSYEATYPWVPATAPFTGGGFNRPASYGIISQANIQTGIQSLMTQKDALGNYVGVNPQKILHSPKRRFDVAILLNSTYYPAGAQSAGVTGGAFAINSLQNVVEPIVCRWMPKSSGVIDGQAETWFLVDPSKPAFIMQMREGVSVVAEAPNSGEGFTRQIQRYRASMRGNADFISPLFMWLGNDGSVTS